MPAHFRTGLAAWWARLRNSVRRQQPAAPLRGGWSVLRRTLSVAVALFVLVYPLKLALDWIDPFGLLSASKRQSENFSTQWAAPGYGTDSTAQGHIAVVLIDAGTLDARDIAWPPRYDYYEEVLRRIVRQNPRAVYVDLLVNRERKFDDSLADAKEMLGDDLRQYRVPVFFGTDRPRQPTLFSDVAGVGELVTTWQGIEYPLTVAPHQELGAPADASQLCDSTPANWSVAFGLYQRACPAAGSAGCKEPAALMNAAQACREISVQWGQRPPAANAQLRRLEQGGCIAEPGEIFASGYRRWKWVWGGLLGNLMPRAGLDARERCPYTLTIHEEQLDDPEIAGLLKDRVVLVGADLIGLNDLATNPVNGQIPGVYVHAMALDNLMTWGRDHLSPVRHAWLASLVLAIITSLLVAMVLRHAPHMGVTLAATGVLLALGPIVVMHAWLRHPPVDWIGSLALFAWVVFYVRRVVQSPPTDAVDSDTRHADANATSLPAQKAPPTETAHET